MQLTPRLLVAQFAQVLQESLFPTLETATGSLPASMRLLASIIAVIPLGRILSAQRSSTGRPAKDRCAMATAFVAKAVLNLATTRDLIARLRVDEPLRRLCGWISPRAIPHESKFSRAFAQFAATELPQQLHEAVIAATQKERLIGHIARDSTAIPARERYPETPQQRERRLAEKAARKKNAKHPKGRPTRAKASERGTRIQRQRHQKLEIMLRDLPRTCDTGTKRTASGYEHSWRGYKLHLDVADGQLPISAVLTSASLHDSQVAIPLMAMTTQRVVYLYELMDSAYDAGEIHDHCRQMNHVPIVAPHPRRGTKKPSQLPKAFPDRPTPELTWAQQERYKTRTMSERVNARLKDEFGASQIRVRGAVKVMAHLMFGVLALTVDQWLRLAAPG
jgi:hypothetical protein